MYKLIIVEDDYQIRNGLSHFFPWNELGFEMVASFENGLAALEFMRKETVDVVLTDVRMPVMSGLEMMKHMREEGIFSLVVILTAYRDFDCAQSAIALGLNQYLVKTTRYDELVGVFQKVRLSLDNQVNANAAKEYESIPEDVISKAKRYIDQHLETASLQTLSEYLHFHPAYLSRLFKKKEGINFADYLTDVKMKKAASLLAETTLSVAQISEKTGYSNDQNFSRAFKKYYGVSPLRYRKND